MADIVDSGADSEVATGFLTVVSLRTGAIYGYQGVVRHGSLSGTAEAHGALVTGPLADEAVVALARTFAALRPNAKLLLNVEARQLRRSRSQRLRIDQLIKPLGLPAHQIVLELGAGRARRIGQPLAAGLKQARTLGFDVAIDDLGEGIANILEWTEVQPNLIRLPERFVHDVHTSATKFQFVRLVRQLAQVVGTQIMACGVRTEDELSVIRDLGIDYAQGPLISAAEHRPRSRLPVAVLRMLRLVQPGRDATPLRSSASDRLLRSIARPVVAVDPYCTLDELAKRFSQDKDLEALPVARDQAVIGLVTRSSVRAGAASAARPANPSLPGSRHIERANLVMDGHLTLQDASVFLAQSTVRQFAEPIVVTESGHYLGMSSAREIMRELTRFQFQAGRHANPLTGLPGDTPINETIQGLLDQRLSFVACFADIARLKAYNAVFGYGRGDNLIKYTAILLEAYCDERLDFFGHHAGGQFILIMRRTDWRTRMETVIEQFSSGRSAFLEPEDVEQGGYERVDRRGAKIFCALPTLAIGAVQVEPGRYLSYHQLVEAIRLAAREAKKRTESTLFIERRRVSHSAPA